MKKCTLHIYSAKSINVADGDTLDLEVNLGFGIRYTARFRLARINTPELYSKDLKEKEKARKAKQFVINWFQKYNNKCIIKTIQQKDSDKKGKYGRYLVYILDPNQKECLNMLLLQEKLASVYQ